MEQAKKALKCFLWMSIVFICSCIVAVVVVDPYFHFHKPIDMLYYSLRPSRVRNVNDGICRHFSYNGIITGSSMTENFKTSEANELFCGEFVKVPYYGASLKEVDDALERALSYNPNCNVVIRGIDYNGISETADQMTYTDLPEYLYDSVYLNDINYVLNVNSMLDVLNVIASSVKNHCGGVTSFDEYCRFNDGYTFGLEAVRESAISVKKNIDELRFIEGSDSVDDTEVRNNVQQNITDLAEKYPEVTFYYYFTPYSIYYWDNLIDKGQLKKQLEQEQAAIEEILKCDNIKLFSFNNNIDLISNLDNYTDILHHGEWINSRILKWMKNGDYQITRDNYIEYCQTEKELLQSFDYSSLWEK